MGWIMPSIFQPGDAELDLLAQLLGGGKSSRLYKKLVYEKQIAQDVSVQNPNLLLGSVFELQATAKPGVKPEDLEKAINEEFEKLRAEGPTQAELDRARNLIETHMISGLERLAGSEAWPIDSTSTTSSSTTPAICRKTSRATIAPLPQI